MARASTVVPAEELAPVAVAELARMASHGAKERREQRRR